ncbi:MAG: hypothetical protein IJP34_06120 [Clostridia bacterium]|nr:hypothetical protein [Clostridia bacterium]
MKYNPLIKKKDKSFTVFENVKGLDLTSEKEVKAGSGFSVCENVWYKDKKIVSRPAIDTSPQNRIFADVLEDGYDYKYRLTDIEVEFEGLKGKLAELNMYYDDSNCTVYIGIVFEDNTFKSIGNIHFGRFDDDNYFLPYNILYYTGKSQNGGGIFAAVSLVNQENFSQKDYTIYEINSDFTAWQVCTGYYIPTVYINGRGDSYALAEEYGSVYTPKPRMLEALNMLDGRFYAYFTTDGYSDSFRLPFSKLETTSVICRVYISMDNYIEWLIYEHEDSASAFFNGQEIILHIDRNKGTFYFTKNNQSYAFARMTAYDENNLRISTDKQPERGREKILSCTVAERLGDKIVFSGGNEKGEVYYSSYNRPLYFPSIQDNIIGSPNDSVTGLCAFEDKLLAFKEKGIYTLKIEGSDAINQSTILSDNSGIFYNAGKYKIDTLNLSLGSVTKNKASKFSKGVIFQETLGDIYCFYKNSIHNISSQISPLLKKTELDDIENAISIIWEDYYMLFLFDKVVMINIEDFLKGDKNAKIFIWHLPEEYSVKGAFSEGSDISLLLSLKGTNLCFMAKLQGEKDQIITFDYFELGGYEKEISSKFETKPFYPDKKGKSIVLKKAYLDLDVKGICDIKFKTCLGECGFHINKEYYSPDFDIKLFPQLKCKDYIKLSFKTSAPFSFRDSEIYYTL